MLQDGKENLTIKSIVDGLNNTYNIGSAILKKLLKQLLIKQKRLQQISTLKLKDCFNKEKKTCRLKLKLKNEKLMKKTNF